MKITALILAGGDAPKEIQSALGVTDRSEIPFRGKPMIHWVALALRASESISDIIIAGRPAGESADIILPDGGSFVANLFGGLEAASDADFVMVATADAPFLTAESLDTFVQSGLLTGADVVFPVVPVSKCYERFPGIKRTAVKIRDGHFTGGNVILMRPSALLPLRARVEEAYSARKSPLKLVSMLGVGITLKAIIALTVAPKLLGIADLEAAVARLLKCSAKAVICNYPEIATDIDRLSDIEALAKFE